MAQTPSGQADQLGERSILLAGRSDVGGRQFTARGDNRGICRLQAIPV